MSFRDRKALQCNKEGCVNIPRTEGAMEETVTKPEQSNCQLVSIKGVRVGDVPIGGHLAMSGNILGHHSLDVLLVTNGQKPGMLLNTLQCTRQLHITFMWSKCQQF